MSARRVAQGDAVQVPLTQLTVLFMHGAAKQLTVVPVQTGAESVVESARQLQPPQ